MSGCCWEYNHRSCVALAMHYTLKWFIHLLAQGLIEGDAHPAYTPHGVWSAIHLDLLKQLDISAVLYVGFHSALDDVVNVCVWAVESWWSDYWLQCTNVAWILPTFMVRLIWCACVCACVCIRVCVCVCACVCSELVECLLDTMHQSGADFTNTFRALCRLRLSSADDNVADVKSCLLQQSASLNELRNVYAPRMDPRSVQLAAVSRHSLLVAFCQLSIKRILYCIVFIYHCWPSVL